VPANSNHLLIHVSAAAEHLSVPVLGGGREVGRVVPV
jgi:hypothetical protein